MSANQSPQLLERELVEDLTAVEERFADDEFCSELYRALAGSLWRKQDGPDGHVSFSWSRAEEVVNELRARVGREPLALSQTGGEGEVSPLVAGELQALGWTATPLSTDRADSAHLTQPGSPPAADAAAPEWEAAAHEEAERARLDLQGAPPGSGGGEGAGGGGAPAH